MSTRCVVFVCIALPLSLFAQNFDIRTIAGFGTYGGDGGPATAALVNPGAVVADANGNLYVSDPANYRIRKIDRSGTITTLIGKSYSAFSGDGGPSTAAAMSVALGLALDSAGNLYFADYTSQRIREITTGGTVRTVAGNGNCGTTTAGVVATQAPLCDVDSVAVDAQGRVYFGSQGQVWQVAADGRLVLVAGTGGAKNTGDAGSATSAQIGYPGSITIDESGNLYIADAYNFVIREVTTDKLIHTVVTITDTSATGIQLAVDTSGTLFYATGTKQVFKLVQGTSVVAATLTGANDATYVAIDPAGVLYIASLGNQRLLKVAGATTTVIAGAYPYDLEALPKPAASVHLHVDPLYEGLAVDTAGNVYFPELDGDLQQRIDKLTPAGTLSRLNTPAALPNTVGFDVQCVAVGPTGLIYFDTFTQAYRVESDGTVTLIAGAPGFPTVVGDGGPAVAAQLTNPTGLTFDQNGNLYIAEPFASRVRKVTPQGIITTFAGTGQSGNTGDGGQAASAKLETPVDVKSDNHGNLYIADLTSAVVRKVAPDGIIETVAGSGTFGFSGDGGPAIKATLGAPAAIAVDPSGNLFIAERNQGGATFIPIPDNNRIRMVNTSGIITTVAGGVLGYNGEGIPSTSAAMGSAVALAADAQGNIYVSEAATQRVRILTPAPAPPVVITSVNTIGGFPGIAQDDFIEIHGAGLAPASVGPDGMSWIGAPEFASGSMPTGLGTVHVTVNGKLAFVSFISTEQIDVLTPLDGATGPVPIVVTNGGSSSPPFTVNLGPVAPSLLRFGGTNYVAAQHADYSLLGPASMSLSGSSFTPAHPGETVLLYAVGFGLPASPVVNGSSTQAGALPALPVIHVGGVAATVTSAEIVSPGLAQLKVVVPSTVPNGDNLVTATYQGATAPPGAAIAVTR